LKPTLEAPMTAYRYSIDLIWVAPHSEN